MLYILIAVVLLGVLALLNAKGPEQEPVLRSLGRTLAGEEPITPQVQRRSAVTASLSGLGAIGLWILFAMRVDPRRWTLELALLASLASLAGLAWIAAGWIGRGRKRDLTMPRSAPLTSGTSTRTTRSEAVAMTRASEAPAAAPGVSSTVRS